MADLNVYFDLDDTLFKTRDELAHYLFEDFGFVAPDDVFLTMENTNGHIKKILDDAYFMLSTSPCESKMALLDTIREEFGNRVSLNFCTHRGYHKKGRTYTETAMYCHGLEFERQIYLCAYRMPDKMEFLRTRNTGNLILIDDNPVFGGGSKQSYASIYVVDKPWNKHLEVGDHRITDDSQILTAIENHLR